MLIVSYIIANTVWHSFSELSNNHHDKFCVRVPWSRPILLWMQWMIRHGLKHMWQWINTLRDFDQVVPRTLFIPFIGWPWFNSEINHRLQIRRNFRGLLISFNPLCEQRLYHINANLTSRKYIPCQNIPYPVEYEPAFILSCLPCVLCASKWFCFKSFILWTVLFCKC